MDNLINTHTHTTESTRHQDCGLIGGTTGAESTWKLTRVVDRLHFLVLVGLRSPSVSRGHLYFRAVWDFTYFMEVCTDGNGGRERNFSKVPGLISHHLRHILGVRLSHRSCLYWNGEGHTKEQRETRVLGT